MTRTLLTIGAIIVIGLAVWLWWSQPTEVMTDQSSMTTDRSAMGDTRLTDDERLADDTTDDTDTAFETTDQSDQPLPATDEPPTSDEPPTPAAARYIEYSADAYAAATSSNRVLFFHAKWCPTCKVVNTELEAKAASLPAGTVVLKVDYDTQTELKKKYGITYQHTFVIVDAQGNELAKWNGGGVAEIASHVRAL